MPANARPRKAYRPGLLNAPVTAGLTAQFAECLQTAEIGLHLRAPSDEHFTAIAAVLNVIGPVAMQRLGARHPEAVAIQSAALAMNAAADRAAAGRPRMYDAELAAVSRGIDAAQLALPRLDVRSLYIQHRAVIRREGKIHA